MIDPSRAVWVVVSVLIVTCPCALSLAAPAALLAAAGAHGPARRAAARLDAIETLARMTIAVHRQDRHADAAAAATAWLSSGWRQRLDCRRTESLLAAAASLAAWSHHPLAQSLVRRGRCGERSAAMTWRSVREEPGQGVAGHRRRRAAVWRLGAPRWVGHRRAAAASGVAARCCSAATARPLLRFRLRRGAARRAPQRPSRALRADGVQVHLLSGDSARHAAQRWRRGSASTVPAAALTPERQAGRRAGGASARRRGRDGRRRHQRRAGAGARRRLVRDGRGRRGGARAGRRRAGVQPAAATCVRGSHAGASARCASCARTSPGPVPTTCPACRWRWPACCRPGRRAWAWRQLAVRGAQLAARWRAEARAMDILYLLIPLSAAAGARHPGRLRLGAAQRPVRRPRATRARRSSRARAIRLTTIKPSAPRLPNNRAGASAAATTTEASHERQAPRRCTTPTSPVRAFALAAVRVGRGRHAGRRVDRRAAGLAAT